MPGCLLLYRSHWAGLQAPRAAAGLQAIIWVLQPGGLSDALSLVIVKRDQCVRVNPKRNVGLG